MEADGAGRFATAGIHFGTTGTGNAGKAHIPTGANGWARESAMTHVYAQAELEGMMTDLESDLVERKESMQPKEIRQAVCAFANDLPDYRRPGVVFVGARDDGTPAGLRITDRMLLQLADIKSDGNIVPPPTLSVGKQVLCGADVAVVTVQPSDSPPVRYRGRIWIRVGPRRDKAATPVRAV